MKTSFHSLVTGADGFIGSHLVETLVDAGHRVRAFVYYNSFNSWGWLDLLPKEKLDQIDVFAGDIRDRKGDIEAIKDIDLPSSHSQPTPSPESVTN